MLTLFYAPQSRATRIIRLLDEMGARDRVKIRPVTIPRRDGSGARDPSNPHPEGKVPVLVDGGEVITESNAIMLYLTDTLGDGRVGPRHGEAGRGSYLAWLAWYGNVVEPVMVAAAAGISHPYLTSAFRGQEEIAARLSAALAARPYLMGKHPTAADILVASPFLFFPDFTSDDPKIRDWVKRCGTLPSTASAAAFDQEIMALA
ncbi:MAG: glutathione S-transferase family protein [Albidovulum sp.]